MKLNPQPKTLQRHVLAVALTAAFTLTAVAPSYAATPASEKNPRAAATAMKAPTMKPARKCLKDLSVFHDQMQKDGYWRSGSAYGYGYPTYGYDYGYGGGMAAPATTTASAPGAATYSGARPGYEVRTLLAAAQILAQRGQQQACETLLGATRDIYGRYAGELRSGNVSRYDVASYRKAQLAAAQPVAGANVAYRADQLIGTEVLNPKGEELGTVNDLVLSPQTGKIAYLVIGRGGLFGINEKYVPVPWAHFKATTGANMLVLDSTKDVMSAAPQVEENRFSAAGDFGKQSQQVDTYWSAHPAK